MARDEATTKDQLANAFAAAQARGFKLIFSFDYAGNGPWVKKDVIDLINAYKSSSAYFFRGSQPVVSTFEGPDQAPDWVEIKGATGCWFIPDWSSLGAKKAVGLSGGVADGLFNWAAWPVGPNVMNTYVDASYIEFLGCKTDPSHRCRCLVTGC
jgi:hypothetical protein